MSEQNQKQKSKFIRARDVWERFMRLEDEKEKLMEEFDELMTSDKRRNRK